MRNECLQSAVHPELREAGVVTDVFGFEFGRGCWVDVGEVALQHVACTVGNDETGRTYAHDLVRCVEMRVFVVVKNVAHCGNEIGVVVVFDASKFIFRDLLEHVCKAFHADGFESEGLWGLGVDVAVAVVDFVARLRVLWLQVAQFRVLRLQVARL